MQRLTRLVHLADWHERIPRYAFAAKLVDGKRVLDLACGSGEGASFLASSGASTVVGVDPSATAIELAKSRAEGANLRFVCGFVEDPFELRSAKSQESSNDGPLENQRTQIRIPAMPATEEDTATPSAEASVEMTAEDAEDETGEQEAGAEQGSADEAPQPDGATEVGSASESEPEVDLDAVPEISSDDVASDEALVASRDDIERTGEFASLSTILGEKFDVILALDERLPFHDAGFLAHVKELLAEDGVLVAAIGIGGHRTLGHLLATFDAGSIGHGDSGFPSLHEAIAHFSETFDTLSFVPHRATLVAAYGEGSTAPAAAEADADEAPTQGLIVTGLSELPDGASVSMSLSTLFDKLGTGVESVMGRLTGVEHRSVVYEEEMTQKDLLIDDLEREVRVAEGRRRESESQVMQLRAELDRLQAELTANPETQRAERERDIAIAQLNQAHERLQHADTLAARLREAVQAQRATIEALRTRIEFSLVAPATPTQSEPAAPIDTDRSEALKAELLERDRELSRLTKANRELERSLEEQAEGQMAAGSELEKERQEQAKLAEELKQAKSAVRTLKADLKEAQAAVEEANKRAKDAVAAQEKAAAEKASTQDTTRATREELKAAKAENEALRARVQEFDALLGRFRRGRRQKRLGIKS